MGCFSDVVKNPAVCKRWQCDSNFHIKKKEIFDQNNDFWACHNFSTCNKCICKDCFEAEYRAIVPCGVCDEKLFEVPEKKGKGRKKRLKCTFPRHDKKLPQVDRFYTCSSNHVTVCLKCMYELMKNPSQ